MKPAESRNLGSIMDEAVSFDGKFEKSQKENKIEEDPNAVKSNYILVKMLDEYDRPSENRGSSALNPFEEAKGQPEEKLQERNIGTQHDQIVISTQELLRVLGSSQAQSQPLTESQLLGKSQPPRQPEAHIEEFTTPGPEKEKEKV